MFITVFVLCIYIYELGPLTLVLRPLSGFRIEAYDPDINVFALAYLSLGPTSFYLLNFTSMLLEL